MLNKCIPKTSNVGVQYFEPLKPTLKGFKILNPYKIISFFLLLISLSANATTTTQKTTELAQLNQKITQVKAVIEKKTEQQTKLNSDLKQLELKMNKINQRVYSIDKNIKTSEKALSTLEKQEAEYQKQLDSQRTELAKQLRALYEMGDTSYLKMLLSQRDPAQFSQTLIYYHYLTDARDELIQQVITSMQSLQETKQKIEKETTTLRALRDSRLTEKKSLQSEQTQRTVVVKTLRKEIITQKQKLTQLEVNQKNLQNVINKLNEKSQFQVPSGVPFSQLKGKLQMPIKGSLVQSYGKIYTGRLPSNGLFIRGAPGQTIHAVASGEVVFADWMRGYGLIIIVSHGTQYMTLYAHCDTLLKEVGDKVAPGDDLGTTGNSGGFSDNGLYFEMRYQGKPINPAKWFKK
jgi:septal ring factor EnvC (AmiA/AmiB activator)